MKPRISSRSSCCNCASVVEAGTSSLYTCNSRTRRVMRRLYCDPKSNTIMAWRRSWVCMILPLAARAACDVDNLPAQESGILRGEEGDHVGDIARLPHAAHWNGFRRLLDDSVGVESLAAGGRARHFGIDKAGRDGVGGDAKGSQFDGERAC